MDIVLNLISIAAFCLSVYNFVYELWKKRKRLLVSFNHVFHIGGSSNCTDIIHISIINKSSATICVCRLGVECNDKFDTFGDYRKRLLEIAKKNGNEINEYKTWTSNIFPVKLEPGGVFTGLISSSGSNQILEPNSPCKITLNTDKGKWKTLVYFTDFCDEKLLSKCRVPD